MEMDAQVLYAKKMVLAENIVLDAVLLINKGKISAVGKRGEIQIPESSRIVDVGEKTIAPGLIDQMVHGSHGFKAGVSIEETLRFAEAMIHNGVTSFLPTVSFSPTLEGMLESLSTTAQSMNIESTGAEILGINFEAPFFTKASATQWDRYPPAGYYAGKMARDPSTEELHLMQEAANGHIRLMTIAPELDGALEVIGEMNNLGIVPSIGHTAASFDQTRAGIEAGAKSATHLYNAMRRQDHREPGVIEAVLVSDEIVAELIADCIHVFPPALEVAVRCKGVDKLILISDNLKYAGLPNGIYIDELGREIVKDDEKAHIPGWTLAGSISPLNRNVRKMIQQVGVSLPEAIKMASLNPAQLLGFGEQKGSLALGKDADLIVIDDDINVYAVMRRGEWMIGKENLL
jgi:N-acetylglucosamine-6-phosphate deacetylase